MDRAAIQLAAFGRGAIPALRTLLFERDPSGIFEPRCGAVWALASLHAYDVLMEFLATSREIVDPVERVGEEAVVNAAARGLRDFDNEQVFEILFAIAKRRLLPGVIETLGHYRRSETISFLIAGLADDDARPAAVAALLELGDRARPALLRAAALAVPSSHGESTSSRRCRRSALGLLRAMGVAQDDWPILQPLIDDLDSRMAMLACDIGLGLGMAGDEAVHRLVGMLSTADFLLSLQLEDCLVRHYAAASGGAHSLIVDHGFSIDVSGERRASLLRAISRGEHRLDPPDPPPVEADGATACVIARNVDRQSAISGAAPRTVKMIPIQLTTRWWRD
ncbi:MAG: hypothetical protein WAU78_06475 [Roseiarcus sp.]